MKLPNLNVGKYVRSWQSDGVGVLTCGIGRQIMNTSMSRSEIMRPMCLPVNEIGQCIRASGEPQFAHKGTPQPKIISTMKTTVQINTSTAVTRQTILKPDRLVGQKHR